MSSEVTDENEVGLDENTTQAVEFLYGHILALGEMTYGMMVALAPFVHSHVDSTDLNVRKDLANLQGSMNALGVLLVNMGSEVVRPSDEPKKPDSGIILPR